MATGIHVRHAQVCRTENGGRCNCRPSYRASAWSVRDNKKVRRTFPTEAAAKAWRSDAQVALRHGRMRAPAATTLREAAQAWLEGAREGAIRTRSGDRFKPATIRTYEQTLRLRVLDELGAKRLADITRADLQAFIERLMGGTLSASAIQVAILPLRGIFRREVAQGRLAVNPTTGLEVPAVRGGRDRIVDPEQAAKLLAALPVGDRALWATALYAGLRRGELMALRWEDVDLAAGLIRVERGWDAKEGPIAPKTAKGRRKVPIAAVLRDYLVEHRMRSCNAALQDALVFGTGTTPFAPSAVTDRARKAWKGLHRITLHEARHTFASLMIAAGVNAKALSVYMGHGNIGITLDRYGHLMPGNEGEAAGLLDSYLERANTAARVAQVSA